VTQGVALDEPVVLQCAQQAVGDRPVQAQRRGDVRDRLGSADGGEVLEHADPAVEGL
jgi:hypothetical protein